MRFKFKDFNRAQTRHESAGFSLVELMIVVAITALIATIGITQYSKVKIKTRATEAKTSLSVLHAAEKSFQAEYGFYHSSLPNVGFGLEGKVYFNVGFGSPTLVDPNLFNYPTNVALDPIISTGQICTGNNATGTSTSCTYQVVIPPISAVSTTSVSFYVATAVSMPDLYAYQNNPSLTPIANIALMTIDSMMPMAEASGGPYVQEIWTMNNEKSFMSGYPNFGNPADCSLPPPVEVSPGIWSQSGIECESPILIMPPDVSI